MQSMRSIAIATKRLIEDTGWKSGTIPPRHAPVFKRTKGMPPGWQWRSVRLQCEEGDLVLLLKAVPVRNKFQAWLMRPGRAGAGVLLLRIEDQPGKRGLHVHVDCENEPPAGPAGIGAEPPRYPPHGSRHRRTQDWTRETFWEQVRVMLRIERFEATGQSEYKL